MRPPLPIAAMREKPLADRRNVHHRPPAHVGYAQRGESPAREPDEVGLPATARHWARSTPAAPASRSPRTHRGPRRPLRNSLRDRRPQPGRELAGRTPSALDGALEHAGGEPAPAGMRRADAPAITRGEQHGQAVGDHDDAGCPARAVTAASAGDRRSGARTRSMPRPCRAPGSARRARSAGASSSRSRARFAATCVGASPTCVARLNESQGAALTPPRRVVNAARTPGGGSQSKSSSEAFIGARQRHAPVRLTTRRDPPAAAPRTHALSASSDA